MFYLTLEQYFYSKKQTLVALENTQTLQDHSEPILCSSILGVWHVWWYPKYIVNFRKNLNTNGEPLHLRAGAHILWDRLSKFWYTDIDTIDCKIYRNCKFWGVEHPLPPNVRPCLQGGGHIRCSLLVCTICKEITMKTAVTHNNVILMSRFWLVTHRTQNFIFIPCNYIK